MRKIDITYVNGSTVVRAEMQSALARVFSPVIMAAKADGSSFGDYLPLRLRLTSGERSVTLQYSLRRSVGEFIDLSGGLRALFAGPPAGPGVPVDQGAHITAEMRAWVVLPTGVVPVIPESQPERLRLVWGASPVIDTPVSSLTCWKGYPFTVPLLVDEEEVYVVTSTSGGVTTTIGQFSPGKYNVTVPLVDSVLMLAATTVGIFDQTFDKTFDPVPATSDRIVLRARSCPSKGTYLRWVDERGDWRYFLFDTIREERRVTDLAPAIEREYFTWGGVPIVDTGGPAGKSVVIARSVGASSLDEDAFRVASGVTRAAVASLYLGQDALGEDRWSRVAIEPVTFSRGNETLSDLLFNVLIPDAGGQRL